MGTGLRARELDDELRVVDMVGEGVDARVARPLGLPPRHLLRVRLRVRGRVRVRVRVRVRARVRVRVTPLMLAT